MQDLAYIEFFAGVGNVYKAVREQYSAVAVDITYLKDPPPNNPMDMNSPSGFAPLCGNEARLFAILLSACCLHATCVRVALACCVPRLAVWLILQGKHSGFFVLLAVVCGSWTTTNTGTSKRSVAFPEGNTSLAYIVEANQMTSRLL